MSALPRKILLAAGGTGGHVIPSVAFGQWLEKQGETVVWLTGSRPLESTIFAAHGVTPLHLSLEGSPLGVSGLRSLKRWKSLLTSFFEAESLLKQQHVDCCVLFGGYLSFPVLMAARRLKIPVLMHEQNTVAGKVSRIAAKLGVQVACAWNVCRGLTGKSKPAVVGMPLRPIQITDRAEAREHLTGSSLEKNEKLIVILGGSLGSGGMKKVLQNAQNMLKSTGCRVLCMGIKPEDRPFPEALVHEASWDMSLVYSAADAVVCRAGASTLAELGALGIPAVVVPWLGAADNHQLSNARCFSELTGSPIYLEGDSAERFHEALCSVKPRKPDPARLTEGSANLYKVLCSLTA